MTRNELDALAARLRAHPGGVPRAVEQALRALDGYLALAEANPEHEGLRQERPRALDLWTALHDAAAAVTTAA
ncbi:hypothetical protein [Streptacidiphilus neutrinimicus]|uniref:hypothetical protein n=1 Tax=Streptacidiphilus neutrinimicus TaxID=105420 RepID=UPI0005AAE759|nr:hypothetical protein [Streptacidiphilus neutrinimicus]